MSPPRNAGFLLLSWPLLIARRKVAQRAGRPWSDPGPNRLPPQKFAAVRPRGSDGRRIREELGAGIKKLTGPGNDRPRPSRLRCAALRFAPQDEVWGGTSVSRALMVRWARSGPRTTRADIRAISTSSGWAPACAGVTACGFYKAMQQACRHGENRPLIGHGELPSAALETGRFPPTARHPRA